MTFQEIKEKLFAINKTLIEKGLNFQEVNAFWNDTLKQAHEKATKHTNGTSNKV